MIKHKYKTIIWKTFNRSLSNESFVKSKLRECAEKENENEEFNEFKCNKDYVGEKLSELNRSIYYERKIRIDRRWKILKNVLERIINEKDIKKM